MNKLRIAIIIPYLHKIEGNKPALNLGSQFIKEGHTVTIITWKVTSTIYEDLTKNNQYLKVKFHKKIKRGRIVECLPATHFQELPRW